MQSYMPAALTDDELLSMGVTIAWESRITHLVIYAALHDFMQDFTQRGSSAIKDFREAHRDNPYLSGALKIGGAEMNKLRQLEERYSNLSGD